MRNYEFTVIFDADEDNFKKGLENVLALLKSADVEIAKQEDMGVRALAYQIKKKDKGHYVYFELAAEASVMGKLEHELVLDNDVMKFLFVNTSK